MAPEPSGRVGTHRRIDRDRREPRAWADRIVVRPGRSDGPDVRLPGVRCHRRKFWGRAEPIRLGEPGVLSDRVQRAVGFEQPIGRSAGVHPRQLRGPSGSFRLRWRHRHLGMLGRVLLRLDGRVAVGPARDVPERLDLVRSIAGARLAVGQRGPVLPGHLPVRIGPGLLPSRTDARAERRHDLRPHTLVRPIVGTDPLEPTVCRIRRGTVPNDVPTVRGGYQRIGRSVEEASTWVLIPRSLNSAS